ncbi:MAG TPA: efflux RND transporter periplasmic adaptor subunit [Blastocatellia bacterium]|nr:efflux RND transporter periplasmic adaptor subunit [Blastocatellia bacterium]
MDREIDQVFRRKQIARRLVAGVLSVSVLTVIFIFGPGWIKPAISRNRIRTAKVESGPIESAITASGTVVPEFEQVLSSPLDARVVKILKSPGAVLAKGDPILTLDVSQAVLSLDKINQQIETKQNQQAKVKLDLESTLNGLQSQTEIKTLEYKSLKAATARNRELFRQGLLSEDKLREVELNEEKAALELKKLEADRRTAQESTGTQLEGLALEMKTLEKERDEAKRQLELATTKSDRNGVLTWVVTEEGATVPRGTVIARIADLNSFRVEATVSDVHANHLSAGMPVSVKINDDELKGSITGIDPTIRNGVITVRVGLDDKSSALLKSNLRVDVLIATDRRDKVLRIKKGPFANAEGARDVFVIRGDTAVKTPVKLGIASFDFYEIVQGLLEGDEVIISDMTDYQHLKEVKIK